MLPRIRTIKPEFFRHEDLYDLEKETGLPIRLAYAGLWTCCDREGRFRWRPRELKAVILPYDLVDFAAILEALLHGPQRNGQLTGEGRVIDASSTRAFLAEYTYQGEHFGYIPSFKRHQYINPREKASELPPPPQGFLFDEVDAQSTRASRVTDARGTRALREREREHLIQDQDLGAAQPVEKSNSSAKALTSKNTTQQQEFGLVARMAKQAEELLRARPEQSDGDLAESLKLWAAALGMKYHGSFQNGNPHLSQAITIARERMKYQPGVEELAKNQ